MQVNVLSEKQQEFNGKVYYLCGFYFQNKGSRLHRAVWEYHHGKIPKGYHVHHANANRSNNDIENLELLPGKEHCSNHCKTSERMEYGRMHIERIRPMASEWHKSEAGRDWHSELAKSNWTKREPRTYVCSFCGKKFETKHIYAPDSNHFCHQNCRAAALRRRRACG